MAAKRGAGEGTFWKRNGPLVRQAPHRAPRGDRHHQRLAQAKPGNHPAVEDPPAGMLHRQASFAPTFFPEGAEYGPDYDFFYLPPIDDGGTGGNPMLTAGDLLVAFDDSPVVREFVEFAGTVEAQEAWASNGNMLCPNSNCDPSVYPDRALAKQGELLADATTARFDASDLMPAQVGTCSIWSEGTSWVAGEQQLKPTLRSIDDSWPQDACGVSGARSALAWLLVEHWLVRSLTAPSRRGHRGHGSAVS